MSETKKCLAARMNRVTTPELFYQIEEPKRTKQKIRIVFNEFTNSRRRWSSNGRSKAVECDIQLKYSLSMSMLISAIL